VQARHWYAFKTMGEPKLATYEDVLAAPEHKVAEIINGALVLNPRPGGAHAASATALSEELGPPFKRGRGGPGGWLLLFEPELHLGADILVPDMAGWRRERMNAVPVGSAHFTLAPDWICEVLSPRTQKHDRTDKLAIYGREGVSHVWLLDPLAQTLEVLRREGTRWLIVGAFADAAVVRAEPFDAIELALSVLWEDIERP
jgi:Uma2 family endonuclease